MDLIRNESYMAILKDFSGLSFPGGIHPTDIDLSVDFDFGQVFVFGELKHYSKPEPDTGQRRHYEVLCDALYKAGRVAFCFVATHDCEPGQRIQVARCLVVKTYTGLGTWQPPSGHVTVRDYIDQLRRAHEQGKSFDFDTLFDSIGGRPDGSSF